MTCQCKNPKPFTVTMEEFAPYKETPAVIETWECCDRCGHIIERDPLFKSSPPGLANRGGAMSRWNLEHAATCACSQCRYAEFLRNPEAAVR